MLRVCKKQDTWGYVERKEQGGFTVIEIGEVQNGTLHLRTTFCSEVGLITVLDKQLVYPIYWDSRELAIDALDKILTLLKGDLV